MKRSVEAAGSVALKADADIPEGILRRKGSPTTAGVPAEVRRLLDLGRIETVNLSEWLVVDQAALARSVLPEAGAEGALDPVLEALARPDVTTAPRRTSAVAGALSAWASGKTSFNRILRRLESHPSDVVRAWACYLVGMRRSLPLGEKLVLVRRFASDPNMGVRECAWSAVRDEIGENLGEALRLLQPFVLEPDPFLRRFATEATRPRGVWCRHIEALRKDPALGLPLLEPVRSDPVRYVQASVGNWLNDASKTCPDWVRSVCVRWRRESGTAETEWICRRALRTLEKPDRR